MERKKGKRKKDTGLGGVLGTTNPDVCIAIRRIEPVPEGRSEIRRRIEPGAAPQDLEDPARRAVRILLRTFPVIILVIPVCAPFRHIPNHIVGTIGTFSPFI